MGTMCKVGPGGYIDRYSILLTEGEGWHIFFGMKKHQAVFVHSEVSGVKLRVSYTEDRVG